MKCRLFNIVIEVTENCNNACRHCYNFWREGGGNHNHNDQLSRIQIGEIIDRIRYDTPLEQVTISGGEPMLRKDLHLIAGDVTEKGLNTLIISNGSLITEKTIRKFPSSALFEITLFCTDKNLHNLMVGNNVFDKVLYGLSALRKNKNRFVIAIVITKLNAHEIKNTIKLGLAMGADGFLLNRINLTKNTLPYAGSLVPGVDLLRQSLYEADKTAEEYGIPVTVSIPIPPCIIDKSKFRNLQFGWCPRGNKNAYYAIGSTGLVRPCNHSSVILGDIKTENFGAIVQKKEAKKYWSQIPQECAECSHPDKMLCRGGCPAASYECFGTAEKIDPFVNLAGGFSGSHIITHLSGSHFHAI